MIGQVQALAIIVSVLFNVIIIAVLRKWTINMKYSLPWLTAGILMLLFSIFPKVAQSITQLLGISSAINTLFFFSIVFTMIMLVILTVTVANIRNDLRKLTQTIAILHDKIEKKIRE